MAFKILKESKADFQINKAVTFFLSYRVMPHKCKLLVYVTAWKHGEVAPISRKEINCHF